jgi:predicted deacylase
MFDIAGAEVSPGADKSFKLKVGKLPNGVNIYISGHIFNGKEDGKILLLLGGIHGDEVNGTEIIRKAVEKNYFNKLNAGTVITIPVLNVFGFINFSRVSSSGKDVNRSFPGSRTGSLASRLAKKLTEFILPKVDMVIDFHTAGDTRYNYPQIRYSRSGHGSREFAEVFNAPFIIEKPVLAGSLRKTADEMRLPVIVFEGGESKRFDDLTTQAGLDGIKRVLRHYEMSDVYEYPDSVSTIFINKTSWVRAREAGLINLRKFAGQEVREKEVLAAIHNIAGDYSKNIISRRNGYILGHNNSPVISMGDALFNIGWEQ